MIFLSGAFVNVDLTLRRGGHINRSNVELHGWVCLNFDQLHAFYSNYGCSLRQHPDGFFFLSSTGKKIKTKLLSQSCVHLGIFIALKARDPEITKTLGWIPTGQLLQDIETTVPREILQKIYASRAKESVVDERIADEIRSALKIFADLNFIETREGAIRPLESINRFVEMARCDNSPDDIARIRLEIEGGVAFQTEDESVDQGDEDDE